MTMENRTNEGHYDFLTGFGFSGPGGTSSSSTSGACGNQNNNNNHNQHQEHPMEQQQETMAGFNDVQKAMITSMLNESLVNTVSKPQVPNFLKDRPELWFILVEAEFNALKIRNDETKYYSVIRALDAETLQQVTDILHNPPVIDKYRRIKEAIIQRTSVSPKADT
ncbi:uncharacterized protein LOC122850994 [Aphidius gifuensis]|uniref:uncharacterized protein LOC122850994 n=1 Tax=Aphidius gifuensis TaxID=684658 RepID=UPI001CDC9417|nr:uncharacterized protein LOC122850994 [Aphidius gifuensis]